jgi:hypothetical protein
MHYGFLGIGVQWIGGRNGNGGPMVDVGIFVVDLMDQ